MNSKKIPPWIWVPTIVVVFILGLAISKWRMIGEQRELRDRKQWVQDNKEAWFEFKATNPAYVRLRLTRSSSGAITVWGKTVDPDANEHIRSFIGSLEPAPVEVGVGVQVVSEEEWEFLKEMDREKEGSGDGD